MDLKLTEIYSYETNKDYAYRMLQENIMELTLQPGSIISEKELAEVLNISRTPIREILFKLQNMNLVETSSQGTRVTLIDISLIDEALDMRLALEQQVVLRLQKNRTSEDMKVLENTIDLQEFYLDKGRRTEAHEQDMNFHRAMYKYAGRERTWEIIKVFSTHFDRMRMLKNMYDSPDDLAEIVKDHKAYLSMIRQNGSADEVVRLLDKHTIRSYRAWFKEFCKMEDWKEMSKIFKNFPSID